MNFDIFFSQIKQFLLNYAIINLKNEVKTMIKRILFCFLLSLVFLTGCQKNDEKGIQNQEKIYTVTFDSNGGSKIQSQKILEGTKATRPQDPAKENSSFIDWYLEDSPYDFDTIVQKDITLIAQWENEETFCDLPVISIKLSDITISQSGLYTSMEEVGSYIYTFHCLPNNFFKKGTFQSSSYTPENKMSVGGDRFYNREGLLPEKNGRTFTECDIDYRGGARNAKRIVFSSDWLIFYTENHYNSFFILRFI